MKTVSLETAKKLKEAAFPQVAEFSYIKIKTRKDFKLWTEKEVTQNENAQWPIPISEVYVAPTIDELLEALPAGVWELVRTYGGYRLDYMNEKIWYLDFTEGDKNLPELFSAMWLWLKSEGKQ